MRFLQVFAVLLSFAAGQGAASPLTFEEAEKEMLAANLVAAAARLDLAAGRGLSVAHAAFVQAIGD